VTKPRPIECKWRQFEPQLILMAVGWYLRFSLSYRDVEELLQGRGTCGPRHHLAMGSALCPRTGPATPVTPKEDWPQRKRFPADEGFSHMNTPILVRVKGVGQKNQ
jgi:hypothetical protein